MDCRVCTSIPGLYPLDAGNTHWVVATDQCHRTLPDLSRSRITGPETRCLINVVIKSYLFVKLPGTFYLRHASNS